MDNETLFYIFGGIAAVSAVLVTFAGLKLKNFPGRMLPLVIVWFAAFAVAAGTFSVLQAQDHEAHEAHELEEASHKIEETEEQPHENEAGALGGETEELEEEAEKEAGSQEEEPVGPTEQSQEGEEAKKGSSPGSEGADSAAQASTTLNLAADPVEIAFDKTELSAKAGKVTIEFDNPAAIPHNVVIEEDGKELAGFEPITEAEESVSADLEPGSYMYVCTVPGHEEAGMVGTLTVE